MIEEINVTMQLPAEVMHWLYASACRVDPASPCDDAGIRRARRRGHIPAGCLYSVYETACCTRILTTAASAVGAGIRLGLEDPDTTRAAVEDLLRGVDPEPSVGVAWCRSLSPAQAGWLAARALDIALEADELRARLVQREHPHAISIASRRGALAVSRICLDWDQIASLRCVLANGRHSAPDVDERLQALDALEPSAYLLLALLPCLDGVVRDPHLSRVALCDPLAWWAAPAVPPGVVRRRM
jgi:hypothetical protein